MGRHIGSGGRGWAWPSLLFVVAGRRRLGRARRVV